MPSVPAEKGSRNSGLDKKNGSESDAVFNRHYNKELRVSQGKSLALIARRGDTLRALRAQRQRA